jgi:branched-chain amino acid transport system permease protein
MSAMVGDMPSRGEAVKRSLQYGLYGGLTLLLVALVGMLPAFSERMIISSVPPFGQGLTLAQVVLFGGLAAVGAYGANHFRPRWLGVLLGGLAGLVGALVLGAFVVLGLRVNLQPVFVNATPRLYEMLTFGRGLDGLPLLLGVGVVFGVLGAGLDALPRRARRAIIIGLVMVVVLGALQDLIKLLGRSEGPIGRTIALVGMAFERKGLSMAGAVAAFVVSAGLYLLWPGVRARLVAAVDARPTSEARRIRRTSRYLAMALGVLVLLWLPLDLGTYTSEVFDTVGLFVLMGLGLTVVVGYAGLLDLGYVAFFAIGAYTVGVLTAPSGGIELSFFQALPIAIGVSVLAGILLGIPVLKTHGDYLAIITLGFGEIIRVLALSDVLKPWIGGAQGIQLIPKALELPAITVPFVGRVELQTQQEIYYLIIVASAAAVYVTWRLRESRYGRAWMAMREDEPVAEASGVNLVNTKLLAFATGASLAGLSGALFGAKLGSIFPHSFSLLISINVLVLIIVGGMGSIPGVFLGALVLVAVPELLREFQDFRLLLYGAVLIIMMLKRPEGLWPSTQARRALRSAEADEVGDGS